MALIKCPDCAREVSDHAVSCGGCGRPIALPADPVAARVARQLNAQAKASEAGGSMNVPPVVAILVIAGAILVALYFVGNASARKPECRMNGFGAGTCSFTNRGSLPWSSCGKAVLSSDTSGRKEASSEFCSGYLWPNSTAAVDFHVSDVDALCEGGRSWTEACSLDFEPAR